MFLYGRNSVFERLRINPKSIKKIYFEDGFIDPQAENLISANNIPLQRLPAEKLYKIIKRNDSLQGIAAEVSDFTYFSLGAFLNAPKDKQPVLIFLDRIYDPQNLGAIIRSAACFGGFALVIPKHKACEVNETVLHVASGGENHIEVAMVANLSNAIIAAKESGYWIMGAVLSDDAKDINKMDLLFPLGLVFGSEGEGVRYGVEKHLDLKACIPMRGASLSFNAAIACAIFCYEISKQRP